MKKVFLFFAIVMLVDVFVPTFAAQERGAGGPVRGSSNAAASSGPRPSSTSTAQRSQTASSSGLRPSTEANVGRAAATRKIVQPVQSRNAASGSRQTATIQSRAAVQNKIVAQPATAGRAGGLRTRAAARPVITSNAVRTTATAARNAIRQSQIPNRTRAAATGGVVRGVGKSISETYTTCRETYFSCMDEFCANKDAALRRCACSSRLHEFDDDKKALDKAEAQLTEFNERLLSVNMDKEDAEAMVRATEGETAYNTKDTSESQQALDAILKRINAKTTDTRQTQSLAALQMMRFDSSSDMFDSVDLTAGATTVTKDGDALYRDALPICVDMAAEVCEAADVSIVQSAYQMSIEQDCNTIAKNYDSLRAAARSKAREGSALLDMSRLTNYQERNSADIITCTKQMMEFATNDSVCGADFGKCLDFKGEYINPMTGGAVLTENLAELENLIVRPTGNETWAGVQANTPMIKFLESKRIYIDHVVENCDDIKEDAWNNFLEEAMGAIKVAQEQRLENMRQGCITLIAQCKTNIEKSIQEFDSRALSIFGITKDAVVNKMCSDIQIACSALMKSRDEVEDGGGNGRVGKDWENGMEYIDVQKIYETVLQNCRIVGQECIKLQCKSSGDQFGLCSEWDSIQRAKIISANRTNNYCYNEVLNCIGDVSPEILEKIGILFSNDFQHVSVLGDSEVQYKYSLSDIDVARKLGKNIWGMCSSGPIDSNSRIMTVDNYIDIENTLKQLIVQKDDNDGITNIANVGPQFVFSGDNESSATPALFYNIRPLADSQPTLLSWFATSTRNDDCYTGLCEDGSFGLFSFYDILGKIDICSNFGSSAYENCGNGMVSGGITGNDPSSIIRISKNTMGVDNTFSVVADMSRNENYFTNCCPDKIKDELGNCCQGPEPMTTIEVNIQFESESMTNLCNPAGQCCFELAPDAEKTGGYTSNWTTSRTPPNTYCVPQTTNDDDETVVQQEFNYIATNGGTHLFCMGRLNTEDLSSVIGNDICDGMLVTVTADGIYRSKFGAGATEKFLNYFYYNDANIATERSDLHILYTYRGTTPMWVNSNGGFFNNSSTEERDKKINHSVAYCKYGFLLSRHGFECCTSAMQCKDYQIQ